MQWHRAGLRAYGPWIEFGTYNPSTAAAAGNFTGGQNQYAVYPRLRTDSNGVDRQVGTGTSAAWLRGALVTPSIVYPQP